MDNYEKALAFLRKSSARGIVEGLSRIKELLRLMGDPQKKYRIIHVSGTNGKGSLGAMLTSVLSCAGYRTGGFSSPAITSVTDSFRINCKEVERSLFADVILSISEIWEGMSDKPTEFEVLTAAAFEIFAREGCDIAVIECGLGGDTDSTNVSDEPLLSVITNVQRDHCAILGNTLSEIASHKAGIIKHGRPVFFGGSSPEALEVIKAAAERCSSELFLPDFSQFTLLDDDLLTTAFIYKGEKYTASLTGTYQFKNAVNTICCIEILRKYGLDIPCPAVKKGLSEVKFHGRFELLHRDPIVIADGAHNPDGIREAADSIRRCFGTKKVILLIGVMADKEYRLYPEMLGGSIEKVYAVTPDNPRSLESSVLAEVFMDSGIPAESFKVLADGVRSAYKHAQRSGMPLIALGSLYMYREFTAALSDHI